MIILNNRSVNNVRRFTRETLATVTTNGEWRRRKVNSKPEHPCSGTSDEVECFFSVMRDAIGRNFTTKQVRYGFRKVCGEFTKRLDDDLPFFYHTSAHTRFQEGPLAEFDVPSSHPRKQVRPPRRELPAAFAPRRATMPVKGSFLYVLGFIMCLLNCHLHPQALFMYLNIHTCNYQFYDVTSVYFFEMFIFFHVRI